LWGGFKFVGGLVGGGSGWGGQGGVDQAEEGQHEGAIMCKQSEKEGEVEVAGAVHIGGRGGRCIVAGSESGTGGGGRGSSSEWPLCAHCPRVVHGMGRDGAREEEEGEGEGCARRPPDLERIWLHCSKYSGGAWSFQCPDPPWLPPVT
jgi:hypothetical protein